jgi:hypothetical protein
MVAKSRKTPRAVKPRTSQPPASPLSIAQLLRLKDAGQLAPATLAKQDPALYRLV